MPHATWGLRQGHVTRRAPAGRHQAICYGVLVLHVQANCHFGIRPQHLCVELQDAALSPRAKMFTEEDVLDLASEGRMRCHHVNESVPRHDRSIVWRDLRAVSTYQRMNTASWVPYRTFSTRITSSCSRRRSK